MGVANSHPHLSSSRALPSPSWPAALPVGLLELGMRRYESCENGSERIVASEFDGHDIASGLPAVTSTEQHSVR